MSFQNWDQQCTCRRDAGPRWEQQQKRAAMDDEWWAVTVVSRVGKRHSSRLFGMWVVKTGLLGRSSLWVMYQESSVASIGEVVVDGLCCASRMRFMHALTTQCTVCHALSSSAWVEHDERWTNYCTRPETGLICTVYHRMGTVRAQEMVSSLVDLGKGQSNLAWPSRRFIINYDDSAHCSICAEGVPVPDVWTAHCLAACLSRTGGQL